MYLIHSTPAEDFEKLARKAGLKNEELTLEQRGLRAVPLEAQRELLRPEFVDIIKEYNTDRSKRRCIKQHAKSQGKILRLRPELGLIHLERRLPAKGQVYVVIVIPPPSEAPKDLAVADSAPSGEVRNTGDLGPYEVVIRKLAGEGREVALREVALRIGDILQLDEDERMEAKGGGIALIVLSYNVVQENHDH
ncbi:hypothetical protein VTK56DRAFT_6639 [Thermocarpiscus australiensis]